MVHRKISNRVYTEEKYNPKGFVFSLMVRTSAGFMVRTSTDIG